MCQVLIFLEVTHVNDNNASSLQVRKYALIHFFNQNVFSDPPKKCLYRKEYPSLCIDDNCDLVRGWAKKTAMIGNSVIPANSDNLQATIGIVNVKDFVSPVVEIPDVGNPTPHSYLFLPPRKVTRITQE